jgi:hypothetical protein
MRKFHLTRIGPFQELPAEIFEESERVRLCSIKVAEDVAKAYSSQKDVTGVDVSSYSVQYRNGSVTGASVRIHRR